ncbi:hypothetical protein QAD02_000795 [Eretmocerus hayati]|uniref:Uncharacterized protein n=1 Tax=Eretmocerus hayati TaxID=131215 RepID=A0ACC2NFT8_9HYME|nr:hypothetical protein QAD02_000795 [Eretmocerus hayati]
MQHRSYTLTEIDKQLLLDGSNLTDNHVYKFHELIKNSTSISPRESLLINNPHRIKPISQNEKHFQIVHCCADNCQKCIGGHWICFYYDGESIFIYDSLNHKSLYKNTETFLRALCPFFDKVRIFYPMVQSQSNLHDCGPFSMAFCTSLAFGEDPASITYTSDDLRKHTMTILSGDALLLFPGHRMSVSNGQLVAVPNPRLLTKTLLSSEGLVRPFPARFEQWIPFYRIRGLPNGDRVSCYANALFQSLIHIRVIRQHFFTQLESCAFQQTMVEYCSGSTVDIMRLRSFAHADFKVKRQQDVAEFLSFLLNVSHGLRSIIRHTLVTTRICSSCGFDYEQPSYTNYVLLCSLPKNFLNGNLQTIIDYNINTWEYLNVQCEKILSDEEKKNLMTDERGFCLGKKKNKVNIKSRNDILILQFLIFNSDVSGKTSKLHNFSLNNISDACVRIDDDEYRIDSVILHHGPSIQQGHYTTLLRDEYSWCIVDDASVRSTPHFSSSGNPFIVTLQKCNPPSIVEIIGPCENVIRDQFNSHKKNPNGTSEPLVSSLQRLPPVGIPFVEPGSQKSGSEPVSDQNETMIKTTIIKPLHARVVLPTSKNIQKPNLGIKSKVHNSFHDIRKSIGLSRKRHNVDFVTDTILHKKRFTLKDFFEYSKSKEIPENLTALDSNTVAISSHVGDNHVLMNTPDDLSKVLVTAANKRRKALPSYNENRQNDLREKSRIREKEYAESRDPLPNSSGSTGTLSVPKNCSSDNTTHNSPVEIAHIFCRDNSNQKEKKQEYFRQYYAKNKELKRKYGQEYYQRNREKIRKNQQENYQSRLKRSLVSRKHKEKIRISKKIRRRKAQISSNRSCKIRAAKKISKKYKNLRRRLSRFEKGPVNNIRSNVRLPRNVRVNPDRRTEDLLCCKDRIIDKIISGLDEPFSVGNRIEIDRTVTRCIHVRDAHIRQLKQCIKKTKEKCELTVTKLGDVSMTDNMEFAISILCGKRGHHSSTEPYFFETAYKTDRFQRWQETDIDEGSCTDDGTKQCISSLERSDSMIKLISNNIPDEIGEPPMTDSWEPIDDIFVVNESGQVMNILPAVASHKKRGKFWSCDDYCREVDVDVLSEVKDLFEEMSNLTFKGMKDFISNADACSSIGRNYDQLGHPIACYSEPLSCKSKILKLSLLAPHFPRLRSMMRSIDRIKHLYKCILIIGTALEEGNFIELRKIQEEAKKTPVRSDVGAREICLDEDELHEIYAKGIKIFKEVDMDPPKIPCVSCERLCTRRYTTPVEKHLKPSLAEHLLGNPNDNSSGLSYWQQLQNLYDPDKFKNSFVCNSCSLHLKKNQLPSLCILNNLLTDEVPEEIGRLNRFEKMLIQRAKAFQCIVKLETVQKKNIPHHMKLDQVKGRTFHLPLPLEGTLEKLCKDTDPINLNHEIFVLVRSNPTKNKVVWEDYVDIKKIWTALEWLKTNNPLYKNIHLPGTPDELLESLNHLDLEYPEQLGGGVGNGEEIALVTERNSGPPDLADDISHEKQPQLVPLANNQNCPEPELLHSHTKMTEKGTASLAVADGGENLESGVIEDSENQYLHFHSFHPAEPLDLSLALGVKFVGISHVNEEVIISLAHLAG